MITVRCWCGWSTTRPKALHSEREDDYARSALYAHRARTHRKERQ